MENVKSIKKDTVKSKVKTKNKKNITKKETTKTNVKNKKISKKEQIELELKETENFLKKIKNKNSKLFSDEETMDFSEFYDLPLRYNETVVRLISQTPTKLFVYWDISDKDKKEMEEKYTKEFWNKTTPILLVKNKDTNEVFEIEINDFANSWYIDIKDDASTYEIELARKFKNEERANNIIYKAGDIIPISNSNQFLSSDKHINFNIDEYVLFKNVKEGNNYYIKNTKAQLENVAKIYDIDITTLEQEKRLHLDSLSSSSNMNI